TAAGRSGSRPACAGCSGSSRPAAGGRRDRSTRTWPGCPPTGPWPAAWPTRRCCPTRWPATSPATWTRCRPCPRASPSAKPPARREPGRLRIGRSLQHAIEGAEVHPDCVAAYEDASALLASLGHEVEDMTMPFGPDVVPYFETLWYAMSTLAPIEEAREGEL